MTRTDTPVLVNHKMRPPGLPAGAISRPRLTSLYSQLLDEHEALAVFAAAGSGKTVQAQLFALEEGWSLAWLTLDEGDHSTTRMLSYLAAALDPHVPTASRVLDDAFERTSIVEEAAALLAEAIDADRLLIVLDHCESIADAEQSCSVLETFVDYLPDGVRTMMLSRSELRFSLGRMLLHGRVGRILDEDLALTLDEAQDFIHDTNENESDLRDRWLASRGWLAAFAFGGPRRPGGADGQRDFESYIANEVLGALTDEERRFMLETSVLDAVSQRAATALCGPASRGVWRRIAMRHLPATTTTDHAIVYHPCLKRYLRDQLELIDPERKDELERCFAELLLERRQFEEAVELFLSLGLHEQAADAAIKACRSVTERGDWDTFLRWADELGETMVAERPLLLGQLIKAYRGSRRLKEARALSRSLDESGGLSEVIEADPAVIVHIAWSMLNSPIDGISFLDRYDVEQRAVGVRYMLETTAYDDPVSPPRGVPWADTDRPISWAMMVQGRLDDLVSMLPGDVEWPPRTPFITPHPLIGLIWRGELAKARELFDQVQESSKRHNHSDLWFYLEAWLLLAEGDPAGAVLAAEQAVAHSRLTGFGFEPVFEIVEGSALIATGRVDDAIGVLEEALNDSRRTGLVAYQEWAHTGLGRARLERGDDDAAREHLRLAVTGMVRGDRLLMLPLAAVYLSEAEWRLGDEERSDAAALVALDASTRMGSLPALQVAMSHFPGVFRRQLQRSSDPRWRRIGSSHPTTKVVARSEFTGEVVAVDVHPFGTACDIFVGGQPANIRRLKVLELAAYLAARPSGAHRADVQAHLFPDSDRRKGSNHFRQVVHQLRKCTTVTLQRLPNNFISWSDGFSVDSADLRFERSLIEARALTGSDRFERFKSALALVDGPYLAASDLDWVCDRRFEFEVLQEEAELEVAHLGLEFEDYESARLHAESLLARNPYSDPAYKTLIQIELAVGSEVGALAVYRRAVDSLREIGLSPDDRMVQLLKRA
jgi:LuxR family maltose regulon positive regulatory protein